MIIQLEWDISLVSLCCQFLMIGGEWQETMNQLQLFNEQLNMHIQ